MEAEQLRHVLVCLTSKEMWTRLATIHTQSSSSHKLLLTQKFHEYRMDCTDSVASHIAKVRNMALQLLDVGENVSDLVITAKILSSLPSKFSSFRSAWNSVDPTRQTVDYLEQRLLEEESFLERDDEENSVYSATVRKNYKESASDSRKGKSKRDKQNIKCYSCNCRGHYARDCPQRDNNASSMSDDFGNLALITTISNESSSRNAPSKQLNALLQKDISEVWLTDSGASEHMTFRRNWFSSYSPRDDGSTVSLGDNKEHKIVGVGTVRIKRLVNDKWLDGRIENVLYVPGIRKNLLSVGAITRKGLKCSFEGEIVTISSKNVVCARGILQRNNVYRMFI
ncbi:unnamed protein product [Trichogramma brassicae]|uniref:CCHC-type domain-containing protein n=1 Tax=Trichogramma brassicae TaxID=86971 RepID=A0A6H5I8J7_9HYME|nr:unnamed protein product [Trichogramma brassicae]